MNAFPDASSLDCIIGFHARIEAMSPTRRGCQMISHALLVWHAKIAIEKSPQTLFHNLFPARMYLICQLLYMFHAFSGSLYTINYIPSYLIILPPQCFPNTQTLLSFIQNKKRNLNTIKKGDDFGILLWHFHSTFGKIHGKAEFQKKNWIDF